MLDMLSFPRLTISVNTDILILEQDTREQSKTFALENADVIASEIAEWSIFRPNGFVVLIRLEVNTYRFRSCNLPSFETIGRYTSI